MTEPDEHLALLIDESGREILAVFDDASWEKLMESVDDALSSVYASLPIADGGSDSLGNLRPSCARCNRGRR